GVQLHAAGSARDARGRAAEAGLNGGGAAKLPQSDREGDYNRTSDTFMEFLAGSLLELIVQTSTNLPPDVRAAMSLTAAAETPGTQSAQALDIILSNIDMAADETGAICQ